MQKKKKKIINRDALHTPLQNNNTHKFCIYNIRPQNGPPQTHFNYLRTPSNRPTKFVDVCGCFSNSCQKSPNCRKKKSRPAMNSPEIGLSPSVISMTKKKSQQAKCNRPNPPPENTEKNTRYVCLRKSICYKVEASKKKCIYQLLCTISSSFQKLNQEISISKITMKNVASKFSKSKKWCISFVKIHFKNSTGNRFKKKSSTELHRLRPNIGKIF